MIDDILLTPALERDPLAELRRARAFHMANLRRLKRAETDWRGEDRARGLATMANLEQQVYAIDAALKAAKPNGRAA